MADPSLLAANVAVAAIGAGLDVDAAMRMAADFDRRYSKQGVSVDTLRVLADSLDEARRAVGAG